jgi:hypothetical protein
MVGPGFENVPPEPEILSEERFEDRETFFALRTGVGYEIHIDRITLTPQVEFDFVKEHGEWKESEVFGASIGFGF